MFLNSFEGFSQSPAIISSNKILTYNDLEIEIQNMRELIKSIPDCSVVAIIGDHTPFNISAFLALIEKKCVIAPLEKLDEEKLKQINCQFIIDEANGMVVERSINKNSDKNLLTGMQEKKKGALVLFTSGSSGKEKAAIHDLESFIAKIKIPKRSYRTAVFLKFSHIGGINSLLQILLSGGSIVCLKQKDPFSVLSKTEEHKIELLPLSSSFISMMFATGAHLNFNLSSLKLVTFGTEPIAEMALEQWKKDLPFINLRQTYGLTETGIFKVESLESSSSYMKIVDPDVEYRFQEGVLELKMNMSFLGYLGEGPQSYCKDGWYNTGDLVDVKGDFFKIKGRTSDLINVSGLKVYPLEVENMILQFPGVLSAKVFGREFLLTNQIVVAKIYVQEVNRNENYICKLKEFCIGKLDSYKIPVDIDFYDPVADNELKKIRRDVK